MNAYSLDLRKRAVRAVRSGKGCTEVAALFDVSVPTLYRWLAREVKGNLAPEPNPRRHRRIGPNEEPLLRAQVTVHPDAFIEQHMALWAQSQGQHLSRATMARALIRIGYSRKKSA
jgi:transposase